MFRVRDAATRYARIRLLPRLASGSRSVNRLLPTIRQFQELDSSKGHNNERNEQCLRWSKELSVVLEEWDGRRGDRNDEPLAVAQRPAGLRQRGGWPLTNHERWRRDSDVPKECCVLSSVWQSQLRTLRPYYLTRGCYDAHGGSDPTGKARDIGRGQELRHAGIRPRTAGDEYHPACGAEHEQAQERGGRANHATYRVWGESAETKTCGAIVRVDEDDRDAKESEVARDRQGWLAVYLHRSCLRPVPIAKPDGQNMKRNFDFGLAE